MRNRYARNEPSNSAFAPKNRIWRSQHNRQRRP